MLERFFVPEEDRIYVDQQQMRAAAEAIFRKMGQTDDDAVLSADVLMLSDLRGCESHGVSNMLASYVEQYGAGTINPRPNVRVIRESDTTATLDCDTGGVQAPLLALRSDPRRVALLSPMLIRHRYEGSGSG